MIISSSALNMAPLKAIKKNEKEEAKIILHLSTGSKITRASDDAAGLSISEKLRSTIRGLNEASINAEHGISMIQTADGALGEINKILLRMRELSVASSTDTNSNNDITNIEYEIIALSNEINKIASQTEFNGIKLLDGSKVNDKLKDSNSYIFHIGANPNEIIECSFDDVRASTLGISIENNKYNTLTQEEKVKFSNVCTITNGISNELKEHTLSLCARSSANNAICAIDKAISIISSIRGKYGALENRLEHTINTLDSAKENLEASESKIRDANMADEIIAKTKLTFLTQSAIAVLIQARTQPFNALSLLKNNVAVENKKDLNNTQTSNSATNTNNNNYSNNNDNK